MLRRCGYRCRYCGAPSTEVKLTIDHIVPVSRGGTEDESNLVAACPDCNFGKGALDAGIPPGVSFLSWLLSQAERHDWVGDLARDEIETPGLREPDSFKDLVAQIRTVAGDDVARNILSAAYHAWREYRHRGGRPTLLMRRLQAPFEPIGVEQAAGEVGARVLLVADIQLREWTASTLSVWENLYTWLVASGFSEKDLETGIDQSLHGRAYCGDALMLRLKETETIRLRGKKVGGGWLESGQKVLKKTLCGERLKDAVAWSNVGSGPMESWRSRKLVGDALFVLESKQQGHRAWIETRRTV